MTRARNTSSEFTFAIEFVGAARQHAIVVPSQGVLARDVRFVADVPWRGIVPVSSTDSALRLSGLTA